MPHTRGSYVARKGFKVINDSGVETEVIDENGAVKANIKDSLARGSIYVGGTDGLTKEISAKADAKILIGDGNDLNSVSVSGDITITNAGVTAIGANKVTTAKINDGAVTYAKRSSVADVTATDDGLTTGLITAGTTFATVTSAGATKAVTLPACAAAGIGQTIDLYVGANGYELLTPASSNNTISTVDSDGTNQLDVAANSLLRLVQVSATGWYAYQVTATTITVVAPDND